MNWYGIIKEEIITNKRKQGEVFDEKAFALEHNISRTPVREAVLKLADEGYLIVMPRRATIVSTISINDIKKIYELRMILELGIIHQIFAKNIYFDPEEIMKDYNSESLNRFDAMDIEFHMSLAKLTGNQYIEQTMRDLMDKCQRFMYIQNANSVERLRTAINEHYEVMNAIAIRNEALATKLMRSHLENSMYAYITTRENLFKLN